MYVSRICFTIRGGGVAFGVGDDVVAVDILVVIKVVGFADVAVVTMLVGTVVALVVTIP